MLEEVEQILKDNVVTEAEKVRLLEVCRGFDEIAADESRTSESFSRSEPYLQNEAPAVQSISSICDCESPILFDSMAFCFTGHSTVGPRKQVSQIVVDLGGIVKNGVSRKVNYLVIGDIGSPLWIYSSYGRKIEAAMNLRDEGHEIILVDENRFISSVKDV